MGTVICRQGRFSLLPLTLRVAPPGKQTESVTGVIHVTALSSITESRAPASARVHPSIFLPHDHETRGLRRECVANSANISWFPERAGPRSPKPPGAPGGRIYRRRRRGCARASRNGGPRGVIPTALLSSEGWLPVAVASAIVVTVSYWVYRAAVMLAVIGAVALGLRALLAFLTKHEELAAKHWHDKHGRCDPSFRGTREWY